MKKIKAEELGRMSIEEYAKASKQPFVIVLDNVRSAHNVGSVFRTADAFGAEAIYLCGITACPPNRDINKTALGAVNSVTWTHFSNTMQAVTNLKNQGYKIVAIEQATEKIFLEDFKPSPMEKYAFIFGNEVSGVAQEVLNNSDYCIEIKQLGTKHSLNVAVCVGIVAWAFMYKQ